MASANRSCQLFVTRCRSSCGARSTRHEVQACFADMGSTFESRGTCDVNRLVGRCPFGSLVAKSRWPQFKVFHELKFFDCKSIVARTPSSVISSRLEESKITDEGVRATRRSHVAHFER